jgi:hypothetical protein
MSREPSVAHRVAFVGRMLSAIHLDHEALLAANEVDDVRPNRFLTNEFVTHQATRPKTTPEVKLGLGGIGAEIASALGLDFVGSAHVRVPLTRPPSLRYGGRPLPASGER